MKRIILDLCGGTGSWSKPYKDAGYDVRLITLPEYDVRTYEPPENVYGILASPPCTEFSLAKTTVPRNLVKGFEIVKACLEIIYFCRMNRKFKFWALENPFGLLRQFLGKPPLTFDPCDYGDPYTKKTDLWGYFNFPKQNKVKLTQEIKERCSINKRHLPKLPNGYRPPDGNLLSAQRAITPPGFAKAFFNSNK